MPSRGYRQCVVAVFIDTEGKLLVGRRKGSASAWQFPQGGAEQGETLEEALKREVHEEIGCRSFTILKGYAKPIPYEFPPNLGGRLAETYRGQQLYWFLCQLLPDHAPDLAQALDQEFDELAWVTPIEAYKRIISWKREAYAEGLSVLGLLSKD